MHINTWYREDLLPFQKMFSALMKNDEEAWELFFDNADLFRKEINDDLISTSPVASSASTFKTQGYMKKFATRCQLTKKRISFRNIRLKLEPKALERKNVDQRLYWRCDDIYLCKSNFSFGVVNSPCIITVGHSPIDLYFTSEQFPNFHLPLSAKHFIKREVAPNKKYKINHSFILVCKTISLFQIEIENFNLDCETCTLQETCALQEPITEEIESWPDKISFRSIPTDLYTPNYDNDDSVDLFTYTLEQFTKT